MVEIREVVSAKDKKIFASYNEKMYRNNPNAIPDLVLDEWEKFEPSKNPELEFCETVRFFAYKDDVRVGRIAGILNHKANKKFNTSDVRFSRVDFIDDAEVSKALFDALENWARAKGADNLIGPLGFTDMDQEGMLVEGFEHPGMFLTIYNSEYYVSHMQNLGFEKDADWVEYRFPVPDEVPRLKRLSDAVLRRTGLRLVEPKTKKELKTILPHMFTLWNEAYRELYGVVELNDAQMEKYAKEFFLLVDPNYLKVLEDKDGTVAGFGWTLPSLNRAMKKSHGRLLPFGWYSILRSSKRKPEVLDLYLVGVKPALRNKGLPAVLIYSMFETGKKLGIRFVETGPELETNEAVQSLWKYFDATQHKRRRSWKKTL